MRLILTFLVFIAFEQFVFGQNPQQDIDTVYHRLYKQCLLPKENDEKIDSILSILKPDGTFSDIDYLIESKDKTKSSYLHGQKSVHLIRLISLANAFQSPKSRFYHNQQIKQNIYTALQFWIKLDPQSANWWWRFIGYGKSFAKICILIKEEMQKDNPALLKQSVKYLLWTWNQPHNNETGANGMDVAQISFEAAILADDMVLVNKIMPWVAELLTAVGKNPAIPIVSIEGGLQVDNTFTQHSFFGRQAYWSGYGHHYMESFTTFNNLIHGTSIAFNDEIIHDFENVYLEGLQWFIFKGSIDYHQRGRHIPQNNGPGFITLLEEFIATNPPRKKELTAVLNRWKSPNETQNTLVGNRMFWRCDYMVQQQPDYYVSYRMTTTRTTCNEAGLGNGYSNFFTGDGVHYIFKNGDDYDELLKYWSWQKLPGVTCKQTNDDIAIIPFWGEFGTGDNDFGGGTSNGKTGMCGYKFEKFKLYATKSIFFMDDYFIVLGTGINTGPRVTAPINTTFNQAWKKEDILMKKGDVISTINEATSTSAPDWIFSNNTAYFFLENKTMNPDPVNIDFNTSTELKGRQIFSIGIEHGRSPKNGTFAYAIAPSISLEATKNTTLPIQILKNTTDIQAIFNTQTNIDYVSFFVPGKIDLPNNLSLTALNPCVVIMEVKDDKLIFNVANPKGDMDDIESINLSINKKLSGDGAVYDIKTNSTSISIPLLQKAYSGKTSIRSFSMK